MKQGWTRLFGVLAGVALCLSVFGSRQIALAQQPSGLPDPSYNQKVRTDSQERAITVVDFDEARIEGDVKAPDGFVLRSRDGSKVGSILELRKNFHQRMRAVGHEGLRAVPMK
jgi:hypothetical protein